MEEEHPCNLLPHEGEHMYPSFLTPCHVKPQLRLSSLQALAKASATVCARLYEFVTDRSGSHVARRLLCVLAGRNVLPAASAGRAKDGASYAKATKVDRALQHCLYGTKDGNSPFMEA